MKNQLNLMVIKKKCGPISLWLKHLKSVIFEVKSEHKELKITLFDSIRQLFLQQNL